MIPPELLDYIGVSYSYIVQRPGTMVYVAGDAVHEGFNWGGNLGGSLNLEGAGPRGIGCVCKFDGVATGINGSTAFVARQPSGGQGAQGAAN